MKFLYLFLLIISTFVFAIEKNELLNQNIPKKEKVYNFKLVPFLNVSSLSYTISDNNSSYNLNYLPNTNLNFGLGFSLYGWGLSASIAIPKKNAELEKYGKTNSLDFQIYYANNHFGIDFYFQIYEGLYLSENNEVSKTDADIVMAKVGGNFYYLFNENFSLKAGIKQIGLQTKLEHSFVLLSGIELFGIDSKENLITKNIMKKIGKELILTSSTTYTLSVSPGYAFTTNNRGIFFTSLIFLGLGLQYRINQFEKREEEWGVSFKYNIRFATGYNAKRFYSGIYFSYDGNFTYIKSVKLNTSSINFDLFFGFRF